MPSFTDTAGREWTIRFDGLLLGELRDALGIDLADVTGETWAKLYADQILLTRAVAFLCAEQIKTAGLTERQFAASLNCVTAELAWESLWGAAKVFFRPKLWSALESAFAQRQAMAAMAAAIKALHQADLPETIKEAMQAEIIRRMEATDSANSLPENDSAVGPAATLSKPASDSPATAASTPAA